MNATASRQIVIQKLVVRSIPEFVDTFIIKKINLQRGQITYDSFHSHRIPYCTCLDIIQKNWIDTTLLHKTVRNDLLFDSLMAIPIHRNIHNSHP